jgi:hypothetical protein
MSNGSGAVSSDGFWILADRGRAVWLPPRGRGNGLDAYVWLKIAEVPANWIDEIFAALASEGVAAWAAERDTMLVRSRRLRRRLFRPKVPGACTSTRSPADEPKSCFSTNSRTSGVDHEFEVCAGLTTY